MRRTNYFLTVPPSAAVPTLTSFAPISAVVGTAVTLTGTRFTGATAVTFNGVSAAFTVLNATTINTTVPVGAATGLIAVTTPEGMATSGFNFTVTSVAPAGAQLVLEGDQQQQGFGTLLHAAHPAFGTVVDNTVADTTGAALRSGLRARLQAARDPTKARHFCLLYVGGADLRAGATAQQVEMDAKAINIICKQEGYELILCSLTSLRGAAYGNPTAQSAVEGVRGPLNTRYRLYGTDTAAGVGAAAVLDLSSIPELGQFGSGLDTTYFVDGTLWAGTETTGGIGLVRAFQEQGLARLLAGEARVVVTNGPTFAGYTAVVDATVDGGTLTGTGASGSSGAQVAVAFGPLPAGTPAGTLRGSVEWNYFSAEASYYVRASETLDLYTTYYSGFAGFLADAAAITPYGDSAALAGATATGDLLVRSLRIQVSDTAIDLFIAGTLVYTQPLTASQRNNPLYVTIALTAAGAKINDLTQYAANPVSLTGPPAPAALAVDDTSNALTFTPAPGKSAADYGYEILP